MIGLLRTNAIAIAPISTQSLLIELIAPNLSPIEFQLISPADKPSMAGRTGISQLARDLESMFVFGKPFLMPCLSMF